MLSILQRRQKEKGRQRMRQFNTITDSMDMSLRKLREAVKDSGMGFQENGNIQTLPPPGQGMLLCTDM